MSWEKGGAQRVEMYTDRRARLCLWNVKDKEKKMDGWEEEEMVEEKDTGRNYGDRGIN